MIAGRPESRGVLLQYYGESEVERMEGDADSRMVWLRKDDGDSETLTIELTDGTWRLLKFHLDWSRAQ